MIPTADSLIFKLDKVHFSDSPFTMGTAIDIDSVKELMIEFAKLHVEAQREAILLKLQKLGIELTDDVEYEQTLKSSILNAYPLSKIV